MLLLHGLHPYHWAIAGASFGALTLLLLVVGRKRLGMSTGFESVCSLIVKTPYFRRPGLRDSKSWRLPIVLGLLLGGALSAQLGGGWEPAWGLGIFDAVIGWGVFGKCAWMFAGGVLVGFGTRLAGGCTSGHGIFGVSNLELSGFVTAASFMLTGILTTNLVYRVLF